MTAPLELQQARFERDPDDLAAFEWLEEHLFMESDWSGLARIYAQRRDAPGLAAHPRLQARLSLRLGRVAEERLADADAAIQAYTEAFRLDSTLRSALQSLRRLYAARSRWEMVLQIGEQEIDLVDTPPARAELFLELAEIWREHLGDAEQADELVARARAEGHDPDAPENDPELVRNAWLNAARGDTAGALATLERALAADPENLEALDMLLTVLEGAERIEEVAPLLGRRAALSEDPDTRCAFLLRMGEVREQLGDPAAARDAYEAALASRPAHPGALGALSRLLRLEEAWSDLRGVLEAALGFLEGPARVAPLCELAALLENEFDAPDAARARLEEAAGISPDDSRVRAALSRPEEIEEEASALTMPDLDAEPSGSEQRATRVIGVLERKLAIHEAEGTSLAPEAVRLRLRISELRGGALGEPQAAVEVLEPVVEADAGLLEVAPALAGLYEQLGRAEALLPLCEAAAAAAKPVDEKIFWHRRAAESARTIGEPSRAIDAYRRLLELRPRDRDARSALCDLHRSRGEAAPLVKLLREELVHADPERELEIQLELASLLAESLRDANGALAHLRRCLELEPQRQDLLEWALSASKLRGGALAQLDLVDHVAGRAQVDTVRASLLARRGALLADELQWSEEAAESWRAALALDPEQTLARERLARV